MPRLDSIKRRMIRQLTEENLAEIEGRPRYRGESPRRAWTRARLTVLVVPLTVCLAVLAQAGPRIGADGATASMGAPTASGSAASAPNGDVLQRAATDGRTGEVVLPGADVVRLEPTEWPRSVGPATPGSIAEVAPTTVLREPLFPAPVPLDPSVFPLPVRTVVLDPGHGGESNVGTAAASGLLEKDLTLDIALRLRSLLERAGYRVVMTRQDDRAVTLDERTRFANRSQGDIFVSIHVNWLGEAARGIETFFLGPTEDPYLSHLASRENRDSGYSLTALREILEGVYANLRQEESRRLAVAVQEALFSHLGEVAPGIVDRGVKTAPFVVLVGTDMPAVLAEVSALSSEEEARLLELPAYREYIALAIFSGIDTYARSAHEPDYSAS